MADAGVENVAVERDALALELLARLVHVGDAQREARVVRRAERTTDRLQLQQIEKAVVAELELGEAAVARLRETQRVAVPGGRALHVGDGHRPEVDVLDDQAVSPL